ncbi:LOW QUALITY PROTEIN: hypothetical protein PanWU01x14_096440, partial [Parasponia andersonii]
SYKFIGRKYDLVASVLFLWYIHECICTSFFFFFFLITECICTSIKGN